MLGALGWILYTDRTKVHEAVREARARVKASGTRHWPPETDDEILVSMYEAVQGTEI